MAVSRGFTLIELLISAAIITVISAIVLVRFTSFDGTVLVKSLAYEVAAGVREAQIYSVSVVNASASDPNFRYPYGVTFTPDATSYTLFRFNNASTAVTPYYDTNALPLKVIAFNGSMKITDVCITDSVGDKCFRQVSGGITRLDISFRRPEFGALFNAPGSSGAISEGRIKICSTRSTANVWIVKVTLLGQITVYKDTSAATCE